MKRIHPLSMNLANQIAAGEVIERPASVVKELLENSLDAGARIIEITIEKGGTRLIKVSDDGHGIHPDDLTLAIMSHATSKISKLDDLFAVTSLGFRGEALASICSVAKTEIISKVAEYDTAFKIAVNGREIQSKVEAAAHPQGSSVIVQDLFFNTPVRRKFLYSEQTEFAHIENLVKRLALSHIDVSFKLIHNEKTIFNSPAIHNSNMADARIKKVFGQSFLTQATTIDIEHDGMHLYGLVGLPGFMRSQNDLQYCFLNKRMVRDKLINHALRQAYQDRLYSGRQPAYLLYLALKPSEVDVNVHPTKHEVRFKQPRQVHDFIFSQINKALTETNIDTEPHEHNTATNSLAKIAEIKPSYSYTSYPKNSAKANTSTLQILTRLPPYYWLLEHGGEYLICDYQQLYQQQCYFLLTQAWQANDSKSRPSLVPITIKLKLAKLNLLTPYFDEFEKLGLHLAQLDESTVVIRQFPSLTPYLDIKEFINDFIAQSSKSVLTTEQQLLLLAQHNKIIKSMSTAESNLLLNYLQQLIPEPNSAYKILNADDWQQLFRSN